MPDHTTPTPPPTVPREMTDDWAKEAAKEYANKVAPLGSDVGDWGSPEPIAQPVAGSSRSVETENVI